MHYGKAIEKLIRGKHLKVAEVAEMRGCKKANVYASFKCKKMHLDTLREYAKVLDVDINDITRIAKEIEFLTKNIK